MAGTNLTYDPSTPLGATRLYLGDTDIANAIFTDAEITRFLSDAGNIPEAAAAKGLRAILSLRSRLAQVIEREGYKSTREAVSSINTIIKNLEDSVLTSKGLQSGDFALNDDNLESFRPTWRNFNDPPIVE